MLKGAKMLYTKMTSSSPLFNGGAKTRDSDRMPSYKIAYMSFGRETYQHLYHIHLGFFAGVAGGSYYTHTGGGSNYQCLPRNPQWGRHTDGIKSGTYMYGAEYEFPTANSPFLKVP